MPEERDRRSAGRRSTARGRRSRERILATAARLIAEQGAQATSLDDVGAAAPASKGQLYHHFGDKRGLVHAVAAHHSERVLDGQRELLGAVEDWDGLRHWAATILAAMEERGFRGGCPIGTLAAGLADTDEEARAGLAATFAAWRAQIAGALDRLAAAGYLDPGGDREALTATTLALVQGGLLLAKTERDGAPLRAALDAAVAHLERHRTSSAAA